ncbi:MAG TPA: hypothetical protein VIF15_18905 [Polyangiaceae bacterium]|jgi:hypothetical protein
MRVVSIALVAAILSAGCALQPGEPGDESVSPPGKVTTLPGSGDSTAIARSPGYKVGSAPQQNPDPAPWMAAPGAPPRGPGGNPNANPDPAPWDPPPAAQGAIDETTQPSGGSGNGSGNAGTKSAGNPDPAVDHWHLYDLTQ